MNRKLKIGIVTDQLLAGGVQLAAIEQVRELNKLGHNAKLLILMRKQYATDFSYLAKHIPHQYLSDFYPRFFRRTVKFPIFSFLSTLHLMSPILAPKIIKKNDYDILISLGTTTCLTTQAIFQKWKIPYIAIIHDPIEYILDKAYSKTSLRYFFFIIKPLARYFEHSFIKDAKKTLIISNVHFDYLKKRYGVKPIVLPYGSKILTQIPDKRGKLLLSFGRWQKEKNPEFLLSLLQKIPSIKLVIAGLWINQGELRQFRSLIKKKNLEKRVRVVPHFEKEELANLCRQARVFIHPHFEAFGIAAFEAAGHGVPIIIPERSGATELFTHNVHGYFPKTVNVDEYTKYIKKLLSDERLAYKMGHTAWMTVKEMFSWNIHAKRLSSLCYDALETQQTHAVFLANAFVKKAATGGGDQFLIALAKRVPRNLQLTIVTPQLALSHWRKARIPKKNVRFVSFAKSPFDNIDKPIPLFIAYCIRCVQTTYLLFKLPRFQVLHTATDLIPDTIPAYLYHRLHPSIPWAARFFHFIENPLKREGKIWVNIGSYILQNLSLRLIRSADLVMIDNPLLTKRLIKKGIKEHKIALHSGGVDFRLFQKISAEKQFHSDALFIGRLSPHKGIFDAIDVWGKVIKKNPTAKLIIIGYGPTDVIEKIKKKITANHLESNTSLKGYLHEKGLIVKYLNSSKMLLFLDHEAGFGLVIAEAMAAGLPVIAYNLPIFSTVYKKGFLCASIKDTNSVAKYVNLLLRNRKKRLFLAMQAKEESLQFDWEILSTKYYKTLTMIAQPPN